MTETETKMNWMQQLKTNGFIKSKKETTIKGWVTYKLWMMVPALISIVAAIIKLSIDNEITVTGLSFVVFALICLNATQTADLRILEKKFEEKHNDHQT